MKRIKFTAILALGVVLALSSCSKKEQAASTASSANEKIKVKLTDVKLQDVEQNVTFTASVEPEVKNNIAPAAPGRIRKIFVEVGDRVTKGQKLAQMDAANLSNSETQIENLRKSYKRVSELFAVGGASQQDLDNAKLQLDVAETNLRNLNENTSLISPLSGIVTARNYDEGDLYSGQMAILTVMQINPVKLIVNVSESYYSRIRTGMSVDIAVDVIEGERFQGKVSLIYPTIDERTRTFGVEVKISNPNNKIRPGMFARAIMNFGTMKHVVVPDNSIIKQSGSGERFVYVYQDGKVTYKKVELGQRLGENYELISGLTGTEQIVVAGQSRLVDGSEVEVVK
jgi:RND family efflux transporter MFP subunit